MELRRTSPRMNCGGACGISGDAIRSIIPNSPEASVLIEKTPDHAVHLDLADELMPGCRVIHVARGFDAAVVASLLRVSRTEWGKGWAPDSINAAAMRGLNA